MVGFPCVMRVFRVFFLHDFLQNGNPFLPPFSGGKVAMTRIHLATEQKHGRESKPRLALLGCPVGS